MNVTELRERYQRLRDEAGPDVTVVVATKYVSLEGLAALVDAGIEVVGENRAQDLQAKHAVYGDAFRWHFIGHLQSNKVKVVNGICELVHSLDSDSAARTTKVSCGSTRTRSASNPAAMSPFVRRPKRCAGFHDSSSAMWL